MEPFKKEIIFSYKNEETKIRQEEFLFQYRNSSILKEYGFIYTRNGILLNMKYYQDLVALTSKKPTRSSLNLLSIEKIYKCTEVNDNYIFVRNRKPISFLPILNIIHKSGKPSLFQNVLGFVFSKYAIRSINYYENVYLYHKDTKHKTNIIDNIFVKNINNYYDMNVLPNNFYEHNKYLNVYNNENLKKEWILNEYSYENLKKEWILNIYNDEYLKKEWILNIYENVIVKNESNKYYSLNIYENVIANYIYDFRPISLFEFLNAKPKYYPKSIPYFAINGFDSVYIKDKHSHKNEQIYLWVKEKIGNKFENLYIPALEKHITRKEEINTNERQKIGYKFNILYINQANTKYMNYYRGFNITPDDKILNNNEQLYIKTIDNEQLSYFSIHSKLFDFAEYKNKGLFVTNEVFSKINNSGALSLFTSLLSHTNNSSINYYNNKLLDINNSFSSFSLGNKDMSQYTYNFISKYYLEMHNIYYITSGIKGANNPLNIFHYESFFEKFNRNLSYFNKQEVFSFRLNFNGSLSNKLEFISKYDKYLDYYNYYEKNFISKYNLLLYGDMNNYVPFNKKYYTLDRFYIGDFIKRISKKLNIVPGIFLSITKLNKELFTQDHVYKFDKSKFLLYTYNKQHRLDKVKGNIRIENNLYKIHRSGYLMRNFLDIEFTRVFHKYIYISEDSISMLKEHKNLQIENHELHDIMKYFLMINTYSDSDQKNIYMYVNKLDKDGFTDDLLNFIYKKRKALHITFDEDAIASKIPKGMFFLKDILMCDKMFANIKYVTAINEAAIKQQIRIWFINDNSFMDKLPVEAKILQNDYVIKITKGIFIKQTENVYKMMKEACKKENYEHFKKYKEAFLDYTFGITTKIANNLRIFNQDFFKHYKYTFLRQEEDFSYRMYYQGRKNKGDFAKTVRRPRQYLNYENVTVPKHGDYLEVGEDAYIMKNIVLKDIERMLRDDRRSINFFERFFVSRDVIISKLPEINELYKIAKEIAYSTTNIDFAWCYQEDEPFDDPFRIDELLLPENDSRYEDFENIIFNKEKGVPRSPVKIIDDYNFIAKYPNHYPIKDSDGKNAYENIAVEYLDVRTSIMRQVFIGYYQLWQDHIFEFSRMTIPQSAKVMLDYLYTWITMKFSLEDIPEALRTFRLIRWYLERGIIECSEYQITYEPHDLTSGKMDSTIIDIPNDINLTAKIIDLFPETVQNNTMLIDTNTHVIKNDPNQLRHEVHITFFIDNPRETSISFSLNTLSTTYIILNEGETDEALLDTITLPTSGKMIYNIPYTGHINKFTIKKLAIDNNDNYFFIGNIVVKGLGKNGDLDISFNPKVQGNKVLNHVSNKVISYMNLYNDNETLMKSLIKGNVHLSEVYEKLLEYWNIHHQDKWKGKRLTIKRT